MRGGTPGRLEFYTAGNTAPNPLQVEQGSRLIIIISDNAIGGIADIVNRGAGAFLISGNKPAYNGTLFADGATTSILGDFGGSIIVGTNGVLDGIGRISAMSTRRAAPSNRATPSAIPAGSLSTETTRKDRAAS